MALSPSGTLFLSITQAGKVVALPDQDGDGVADRIVTVSQGLDLPHGLAFHGGYLYVAETGRVVRFPMQGDQPSGSPEVVVPNLPRGAGHFTRSLGIGPDGKLYVSIGSSCNVCLESDPRRAAIVRYNLDGSGEEIYARGLRNAVSFVWRPGSDELWATDMGRDWLGDDFPPDELNLVRQGADYGWPYCNGSQVPDPDFGSPQRCASTVPPRLSFQAHSAPIGLRFCSGCALPLLYQGQLFVAFHGSWNRSVPTGYKVVVVPFRDSNPTGYYDFVTGWLVGTQAWGRPVDVIFGADGALYISDDRAGAVYRVSVRR
jgi:glucose/arabinose dehydrogenase